MLYYHIDQEAQEHLVVGLLASQVVLKAAPCKPWTEMIREIQ